MTDHTHTKSAAVHNFLLSSVLGAVLFAVMKRLALRRRT